MPESRQDACTTLLIFHSLVKIGVNHTVIVIPIKVGTSHQSEKLGFTTVQPNLPVSFLLGITILKKLQNQSTVFRLMFCQLGSGICGKIGDNRQIPPFFLIQSFGSILLIILIISE